MGSEEHVCPTCGQPVETVVRRHKTLGAWVPRWVPGPCRNPECAAYDAEVAEGGHAGEGTRTADQPRSAEGTAPPATTPPEDAPGETVVEKP
ncbi:hypothetical protein PV963_30875 [Streptomyces coeruleorubidus]|uniref:hypothetical protein n=1 Tax=Streptomyces coeruleorubidus TaxID=116188 RepID=UPI00237FCA7B|nr:hypothetical protein [Streptomyces coeruleorubidus]WDV54451.1 hypothetical protein PV963_30875 [Streptomyces coeruleorubidus]